MVVVNAHAWRVSKSFRHSSFFNKVNSHKPRFSPFNPMNILVLGRRTSHHSLDIRSRITSSEKTNTYQIREHRSKSLICTSYRATKRWLHYEYVLLAVTQALNAEKGRTLRLLAVALLYKSALWFRISCSSALRRLLRTFPREQEGDNAFSSCSQNWR